MKQSEKIQQRQDWLADRINYLGGTDVGAILGLNPYRCPIRVWLEKTGKYKPKDITDMSDYKVFSEPAYWGIADEKNIANRFTQETNLKVVKPKIQTLQHPSYSFMRGTPDFIGAGKKQFVLECKSTTEWNKKAWDGDKIPAMYELQVLYYMMLLNYEYGYIAVRIGNTEYKHKLIYRDPELEKTIIDKMVYFWNEYVLKDKMPPADSSDDCSDVLDYYNQQVLNSYQKIENKEFDEMLKHYFSIKEIIKQSKEDLQLIENNIKLSHGDIEVLDTGIYRTSYKTLTRRTIDTDKLKKELPDIYEKYLRTTDHKILKITERTEV